MAGILKGQNSLKRKENKMRRIFKRQEGLTIIELLVVIAILGVLASIIIPSVGGVAGSSKEQSYNEDTNNIQKAVDSYYAATAELFGDADRDRLPVRATAGGKLGSGLPEASHFPSLSHSAFSGTDAYINFGYLVENITLTDPNSGKTKDVQAQLSRVPKSAGPGNVLNRAGDKYGTGHYSWYIDKYGKVHSYSQDSLYDFDGKYP
ncbi:MAG: type II secretion system protein [Chloroflexi bacterium]|nr:type II secretion system protein [Chloroflexota bacterium]